jgi:hypothetical protein
MKHVVLAALIATCLAAIDAASAQPRIDGYYDDDHPRDRYRYRERYDDDRPGYDRREDYRERRGSRTQRCRPGFTVQDGVCKPYTGR